LLLTGGVRVIYGLIAAAGWGLSTVAAAGAARQLGSYYAVLISQLLGLIGLGMLAAIKHPTTVRSRPGPSGWSARSGPVTEE
jgi:hypothetical protein